MTSVLEIFSLAYRLLTEACILDFLNFQVAWSRALCIHLE